MKTIYKIIYVLTVIFFVLLLSSCGSRKADYIDEQLKTAYFTDGDNQSFDSNSNNDSATIRNLLMKNVEYIITSVGEENCIVEVRAPNMSKLLMESVESSGGLEFEEAKKIASQYIIDALTSGDYEESVVQITVLIDENGEIIDYSELTDAIYGGLASYLEKLLVELSEVENE